MLANIGELGGDIPELVAMKAIPGALPWSKFGFGVVTTTFSTIYSAGADPGLYEYLESPQTVGVASTDPDDTLLGDGANIVEVSGLCLNGCLHSEYVQLDGQNPVESQVEYSRVFRVMNVSRNGHDLQGQLYVGPYDGVWAGGEPDHILAHVNDGYNQTQMALFTVPEDYYLFVYNVVVTTGKDKAMEVAVFARDANIKDNTQSGVMAIKINWLLYQSPLSIPLSGTPFVFPPSTDFEFRAKTTLSSGSVAANATGVLIPKKYLDRQV